MGDTYSPTMMCTPQRQCVWCSDKEDGPQMVQLSPQRCIGLNGKLDDWTPPQGQSQAALPFYVSRFYVLWSRAWLCSVVFLI